MAERPLALAKRLEASGEVLILARHPLVIAAARAAAQRVSGQLPRHTDNALEALAHLSRPGLPPRRVMLEPAAMDPLWTELLSTIDDPSLTDAMVFVAAEGSTVPDGVAALPPEAAQLERALSGPRERQERSPPRSPEALAAGLDRGALLVRYQPVVDIATRRLVMVEALSRWRGSPMAHGPDSFVPQLERAGLSRALAVAVVSRSAQDFGTLAPRLGIRVSVNVSLDQLLQRDLPLWIARARATGGLPARALGVELTENMPVRDLSTLHRAIRHMNDAGQEVYLDDLTLDDGRLALTRLPFAGIKLDKGLVMSLPDSARARQFVLNVVRHADRAGQMVTAEGVADERLWHAVSSLGVHRAQGFWVGRPLPHAVLPAWRRSWAGSHRG